jgi:cephalosporin hydroxylase
VATRHKLSKTVTSGSHFAMLGQILRDIFGTRTRGEQRTVTSTQQADIANPLAEYFYSNNGEATYKWHHYFEIYHRHFQKFRRQSPVIVEIGVAKGGSLPMWHHYFGPGTRVVGIDVDPECRKFATAETKIIIGDQSDRAFLASVRASVPHIDILIDDGGHTMIQQIATFEELYPHLQPNGIYVCEDTHTSYWSNFGGGNGVAGTFVEYCKAMVDKLHAWHSRDPAALAVDQFTRTTHSLHFYDSVVVMEKRPIEPPRQFMTRDGGLYAVQPILPPKA